MDPGWIGGKLVGASGELAQRFREETPPEGGALAALAESFLRELGGGLLAGATDARRPFRRTRGVLRLPTGSDAVPALREFVRLDKLVREYVSQLPGASREVDRYLSEAARHALQTTAAIYSALLAGMRTESERAFGGVVVLEFRPRTPAPEAADAAADEAVDDAIAAP